MILKLYAPEDYHLRLKHIGLHNCLLIRDWIDLKSYFMLAVIFLQPVPLADIEQMSLVTVTQEDELSRCVRIHLPTSDEKVTCQISALV